MIKGPGRLRAGVPSAQQKPVFRQRQGSEPGAMPSWLLEIHAASVFPSCLIQQKLPRVHYVPGRVLTYSSFLLDSYGNLIEVYLHKTNCTHVKCVFHEC
jgi:hypothetical protein